MVWRLPGQILKIVRKAHFWEILEKFNYWQKSKNCSNLNLETGLGCWIEKMNSVLTQVWLILNPKEPISM